MPYTYNIEGTQTPDSKQETNDMDENQFYKIEAVSEYDDVPYDYVTFEVLTKKEADALVEKLRRDNFFGITVTPMRNNHQAGRA